MIPVCAGFSLFDVCPEVADSRLTQFNMIAHGRGPADQLFTTLWFYLSIVAGQHRPVTDFRATHKAKILLSYEPQYDPALRKALRGNCHAQ